MKRGRLRFPLLTVCAAALVVSTTSAAGAPTTPTATWSVLPLQGEPPFRYDAGVAYNPQSKRVLVFGGFDANQMGLADTWVWNGTAWRHLHPATSPPARGGAVMGWDGKHVVLFGGSTQEGGVAWYGDTWKWSHGNWKQVDKTGASPAARSFAASGWNGHHLVLYGGWDVGGSGADGGGNYGDTWAWHPNAGHWHELAVSGPGVRRQAVAAYSKRAGGLLLYGGTTGGLFDNDTWVLQADGWHQLAPNCGTAGCPPAPRSGAMTSDAGRALVAVSAGTKAVEQVWQWTGSWQRVKTNEIGGRIGAGLAWFSSKHEGLLVCGYSPHGKRRASATLRWVSRA